MEFANYFTFSCFFGFQNIVVEKRKVMMKPSRTIEKVKLRTECYAYGFTNALKDTLNELTMILINLSENTG